MRFYKNDRYCFELTVLESINLAGKVRCHDKMSELNLPGKEDFKVISKDELLGLGLEGFEVSHSQETYELQAYLHTYQTFSMDRSVFGEEADRRAPRRNFLVNFSDRSEVLLNQNGIEVNQLHSRYVGPIGILSEREETIRNKISTSNGGILFSDFKGKIMIFKPFAAEPFGIYELRSNPQIFTYMEELMESSKISPVCHRDNYVSSGPNDCHRMIFERHSLAYYKKITSVIIDFKSKRLEFFEVKMISLT